MRLLYHIRRGCSKIAILDLSQEHSSLAATSLVETLVKAGKAEAGEIDAVGYAVNVADEVAVSKTIEAIAGRWGQIDCLVTSAGMSTKIAILSMS